MQLIEIIIGPQGTTKVQTSGFVGAECRAASHFLEAALGRVESEILTTEFHQVTPTQHEQESEHV